MERRFHRKCCRRKCVLFCHNYRPCWTVFVNIAVLVLVCLTSYTQAADGPASVFTDLRFTRQPATELVVKEGDPARLDCDVTYTGQGQLKVWWVKHGAEVKAMDTDRSRFTLSNHSLMIPSVTDTRRADSDVGEYRCVASVQGLGLIHSRKARLSVTSLKKFDTEPQPLELAPGDNAAFECVITGKPAPDIKWYKGDLRVKNTKERSIYPTGMLEIRSLSPEDYGLYTCSASVPGKTKRISKSAELKQAAPSKVMGVPKFVVRPRSTRVTRGDVAFLHCVAQNRDQKGNPPIISWLRDGVTIETRANSSHFDVLGAGTLIIKNVTESDSGRYTCRAQNLQDSVDASAQLNVLVPPSFVQTPANSQLPAHSDVTLGCQVTGVPEPTVSWLKNGEVVTTNSYIRISNTGSLSINGLLTSDAGLYQCRAENEAGESLVTAQLLVTPQASPPTDSYAALTESQLRAESPPLMSPSVSSLRAELVSSSFITLKWDLPAIPTKLAIVSYRVIWREIQSERERFSDTKLREFHISELRPLTQYEIRVRSFTKNGPSKNEAKITVTTKNDAQIPSAPQNLKVTALSSTSIKAEWEPPQDPKGLIESYTLIYFKTGFKADKLVTAYGSSHVLEGLEEHCRYIVRVMAANEHGTGYQTKEQEVLTYSAKPSGPPQNFSLEVTSSTSIIVRWEPPPTDDQNGLIVGYKIRIRQKGYQGQTFSTDGDRTTYALKQLEKGQEYQVRVAAMTVNGTGPATAWDTAVTFEDDLDELTVPPQPARLLCVPKANSITVSWAPPDPHSKILVRGYVLSYGKGVPDVYQVEVDANTNGYIIRNLQPSSEYVIKIRAFNNKGPGHEKMEIVATTDESELNTTPVMPPMGLNAHVLSPTTILLSWADHSLSRGRKIMDNRYYTIKYRALTGKMGKYKHINATELTYHILGLRPNTEYEFMVRLVKGPKRSSEFSMAVRNKTEEKMPDSEPRDVTPVPLENDPLAVSLNWQPPDQPNGQITGYLIHYTNDLHQDEDYWPMEGVVGDKLSFIIDKLTPDTRYHFQVQARNSKGLSPRSKAVTYVTPKVDVPLPSEGSKGPGLTTNVIIIIGACVAGFVFCSCVIGVIVYLCVCRGKRHAGHPKNLAKVTKLPPAPVKQPPDLWIHQPSNLELHKMDRRSDSSASVATSTLRRGSRGSGDDDQTSTLDRRRNSYIGEGGYPSSGEERYQPIQPRNLIRPKPITLPGDPGFREPIATVTAAPNGHILQYGDSPGGPVPMRPIYPRTQYNTQYSSAARVNAGDVPHSCPPSTKLLSAVDEDDRDPEMTGGMEDSFTSRIGYVKPQPNISPYKKPNGPVLSGSINTPNKGQRTPVSFNSKSPELKTKKEEADLSQKSSSTEELTAEMANLEGLMKDLNAITQQEFEC